MAAEIRFAERDTYTQRKPIHTSAEDMAKSLRSRMAAEIRFAERDPNTGFMVTQEEAYLPDEWDEAKYTCRVCSRDFVEYYPGDEYRGAGQVPVYCSTECRVEQHRQDAKAYAKRHRAYDALPENKARHAVMDAARAARKRING